MAPNLSWIYHTRTRGFPLLAGFLADLSEVGGHDSGLLRMIQVDRFLPIRSSLLGVQVDTRPSQQTPMSLRCQGADSAEEAFLRHHAQETETYDRRGLEATPDEVGILGPKGLIEAQDGLA
jgi:hypothetical protein